MRLEAWGGPGRPPSFETHRKSAWPTCGGPQDEGGGSERMWHRLRRRSTLRHHDHHARSAVALLDRLVHLRDLVETERPHRQVLEFPCALQALEVLNRAHIGL